MIQTVIRTSKTL